MKKNKVLLVSSNMEEVITGSLNKYDKVGMKTDDSTGYPLGLLYLHSNLEYHGYETETLFLNNNSYDYALKKIEENLENFLPEFIGFQVLTQNRISTFNLIEFIKKKYQNIKIILGGIHATVMYEQILKKFPYVTIILGEGEITLIELIKNLKNNPNNLSGVNGIAYFDETVKLTPPRPLIENLDELPFPKHEIFLNSGVKCGIVLTARGCPFACSFCCLDNISKRRVRKRSIAKVIEEIEMMIQKFPKMTNLWIQDDTFFMDIPRVIEFCDEIIKRKIKLNIICSARFKPISEELIDKIEKANFKKIFFGLESGDNEILKKCHKGINQDDILTAIKLFKNRNISIYAHLIVGLPGETLESVKTTAKFVQKLLRIKYINYHTVYSLTVYPGTEVYQIAKSKKMIDDDFWLSDNNTPIYTAEHTLEELNNFKEILLDNISGVRALLTWRGFIKQFRIIPVHLRFYLSSKTNFFNLVYYFLRIRFSDNQFNRLKKIKSFINKIL